MFIYFINDMGIYLIFDTYIYRYIIQIKLVGTYLDTPDVKGSLHRFCLLHARKAVDEQNPKLLVFFRQFLNPGRKKIPKNATLAIKTGL